MLSISNPKISVLIITYNQKNVISRTLDSLVSQKDYIYEICINDDCSSDGTWDVIINYANNYPELIKPTRNAQNQGIFRNTELSWKRASGNMIYEIAGDDVCPDEYFKNIWSFVENGKLDCENDSFCIYTDYQQIDINGSKITFSNKLVERGFDSLKLKLRQLISARGAIYSRNVLNRFQDVSDGRNFAVELAQDSQVHIFAKRNYYLPICGCIYYSGIGISSCIPTEEKLNSAINVYEYFKKFLAKLCISLDNKDIAYINFMKEYRYWSFYRKPKYLFAMIVWFLLSIDLSLGLSGMQLNRVLFVIRKRL